MHCVEKYHKSLINKVYLNYFTMGQTALNTNISGDHWDQLNVDQTIPKNIQKPYGVGTFLPTEEKIPVKKSTSSGSDSPIGTYEIRKVGPISHDLLETFSTSRLANLLVQEVLKLTSIDETHPTPQIRFKLRQALEILNLKRYPIAANEEVFSNTTAEKDEVVAKTPASAQEEKAVVQAPILVKEQTPLEEVAARKEPISRFSNVLRARQPSKIMGSDITQAGPSIPVITAPEENQSTPLEEITPEIKIPSISSEIVPAAPPQNEDTSVVENPHENIPVVENSSVILSETVSERIKSLYEEPVSDVVDDEIITSSTAEPVNMESGDIRNEESINIIKEVKRTNPFIQLTSSPLNTAAPKNDFNNLSFVQRMRGDLSEGNNREENIQQVVETPVVRELSLEEEPLQQTTAIPEIIPETKNLKYVATTKIAETLRNRYGNDWSKYMMFYGEKPKNQNGGGLPDGMATLEISSWDKKLDENTSAFYKDFIKP